ncbi:MAG TPA: glycosyltransferase family 2 protein [Alphaproteobacteria bacterium]|nr:glycosyltransferase family 2 protein [Alphaproteobacteria bacterium]
MNIIGILSITITSIFFLIILSYYILLFKKDTFSKHAPSKQFNSITVIIPAHNEQKYIAECLNSVLKAKFNGKKEIIVVNDGSADNTGKILKKFESKIKLINIKHSGKSTAINTALRQAKGKLIAIVDADSIISIDSLNEAKKYFSDPKVGAVTSVIKVKNDSATMSSWIRLEQLYNSLLRQLFCKINVNIVTPGPLSIYRKDVLENLGGFGVKGLSEDVDIAVRIIKSGRKIAFSKNSVAETNMPENWKGFSKQRSRFAKGWINIFKRHLKMDKHLLQIYTLPIALFGYFQAVIMGLITLYNIISGYIAYFYSQGIIFNLGVAKFLFEWFSIFGTLSWAYRTIMNPLNASMFDWIGILASLLIYPLYIIAISRYDKFTWKKTLALIFMFPFWLIIMVFYVFNIKELFVKKQKNIWTK